MPAKQQIAKKLGFHGTKEVNQVISQYQMIKMQHGWLKRESYRGRTMPGDYEEVSGVDRRRRACAVPAPSLHLDAPRSTPALASPLRRRLADVRCLPLASRSAHPVPWLRPLRPDELEDASAPNDGIYEADEEDEPLHRVGRRAQRAKEDEQGEARAQAE